MLLAKLQFACVAAPADRTQRFHYGFTGFARCVLHHRPVLSCEVALTCPTATYPREQSTRPPLNRPFFRCQTDPQLEWQQLYFTLSAQRKIFGGFTSLFSDFQTKIDVMHRFCEPHVRCSCRASPWKHHTETASETPPQRAGKALNVSARRRRSSARFSPT